MEAQQIADFLQTSKEVLAKTSYDVIKQSKTVDTIVDAIDNEKEDTNTPDNDGMPSWMLTV